MDAIEQMVVETALKDMVRQGYVSICTIDKVLKMLCVVPDRRDYEMLSLLHCVNFKDMPAELRRGLPVLLQRVIGGEQMGFRFPMERYAKALQVN